MKSCGRFARIPYECSTGVTITYKIRNTSSLLPPIFPIVSHLCTFTSFIIPNNEHLPDNRLLPRPRPRPRQGTRSLTLLIPRPCPRYGPQPATPSGPRRADRGLQRPRPLHQPGRPLRSQHFRRRRHRPLHPRTRPAPRCALQ